jgi:sensor c-di-GMP phosphodiesterase-like protein
MVDLAAVRQGLAQGEFLLEYLPTISLVDDQCIGAEALIRWHRAGELIQPGDFVPDIENTPVSGLLTYWVMDTIASEMGEWLRAHRDVHISFNVPPEILGRGGMEYVATKSGLVDLASQLIVEITERGIPDALGVASINQGGTGVKVALDDVTFLGGANLAVLARCNFFAIKLDKSLIDPIAISSAAPEWLDVVAALRKSSQILVIAEGVETAQQAATLRAANVQAAQGFFFSGPLSAPAFIAFHRHRRSNR